MQLTEIDLYVQEKRELAASLIANAQEQVKQEVEAARLIKVTELQQENQQLLTATEEKLKQALDSVYSNVSSIIVQILTKCGIMEVDHAAMKELLSNELAKFIGLGELRIKAHPETLEYLSYGLNLAQDKIVLEANPSLAKEVCICETNLWIMNLAVNEVKQKILGFLQADIQDHATKPIAMELSFS